MVYLLYILVITFLIIAYMLIPQGVPWMIGIIVLWILLSRKSNNSDRD